MNRITSVIDFSLINIAVSYVKVTKILVRGQYRQIQLRCQKFTNANHKGIFRKRAH